MVDVARILNQTNTPYRLKEGDYFATAEPVTTYRGPDARSRISSDLSESGETRRAANEQEWKWRPRQAHRRREQAAVNEGEAAPSEPKQSAQDYSHQCR